VGLGDGDDRGGVLALEAGIDERGDGARDQTASADGGDDGGRDGRPRQAAAHLTTCRPPRGSFPRSTPTYCAAIPRACDADETEHAGSHSGPGNARRIPRFQLPNLRRAHGHPDLLRGREWRRCSLLGIVVLLLSVAANRRERSRARSAPHPTSGNWRCCTTRDALLGTLELLHLHHFGLKRIRLRADSRARRRLAGWPPVHQLRRVRAGARTFLGFGYVPPLMAGLSRSAERRARGLRPRVRSRDPKPEWLKVRMPGGGATSR